MTSWTRRDALKLSAFAAVAAPAVLRMTSATAADFTLKYANNAPASHPLTIAMVEATDAIRSETNGKVDIRVFPNSQLGGDTDMLSQLRSGGIDFFTLSPLILSTLVPVASISGVGFVWKTQDDVWKGLDGALGALVRAEIEKRGIYAFPKIFNNGFRQISSSTKPIATPDDLKGFKIRVPPSPMWISMFEGFGAAPLTINFAEVYSALQTHIADGQENPLVTVESAKLYEVQKYVSKTSHMWDGFWLLANGRKWKGLPEDVQEVISKNIDASTVRERAAIVKNNSELEATIAGHGVQFNDVDAAQFQAVLKNAGFYDAWHEKFGAEAWGLLEQAAGTIG